MIIQYKIFAFSTVRHAHRTERVPWVEIYAAALGSVIGTRTGHVVYSVALLTQGAGFSLNIWVRDFA